MRRGAPGRVSGDAIVLIALFVLLVLGVYFLVSPGSREASDISTSYSADPKGVKAFYTLLGERLGYRVDRLEKPYTEIPKHTRALFVVQPSGWPSITDDEVEALERWVSRGGTVIFLSDKLTGIPVSIRRSDRRGKGFVYSLNSRHHVTNEGVRNYGNALAILYTLAEHARPGDLVLFDEYHHGLMESEDDSVSLGPQAGKALWILLVAGLVLCYSVGRRFGAVRALPKSEIVRPGVELVNALARLYKQAHATDLAAGVLCEPLEQAVLLRPELNTPRVQAVLETCRSARAGQKLTDSELLNVAREIHELEKELGVGC